MPSAGRQSGEYPVPVTQEQFGGFYDEFRNYTKEAREWMATVNRQLADGQATMAVLRADSATYLKRSDEHSSKINLLTQKEGIRLDREKREEVRHPNGLPALKPTIWERLKDNLLEKALGVVALAVLMIGYHEVAMFMIAHPSLAPSGEGFSAPRQEHERGREPVQSLPMSAPLPTSTPKPP